MDINPNNPRYMVSSEINEQVSQSKIENIDTLSFKEREIVMVALSNIKTGIIDIDTTVNRKEIDPILAKLKGPIKKPGITLFFRAIFVSNRMIMDSVTRQPEIIKADMDIKKSNIEKLKEEIKNIKKSIKKSNCR